MFRRKTLLALLAMAVLATPLLILAPTAQADPAVVVLVPERIVGGPGHAGLYGWGAATMRDGSVLVGDYWNKRVQRWAADGTYLGVFIDNANYSATGHQAPYGLAVDPDNGDVYLADTDRRQVDRYTEAGVYVESYGQNGVSGNTATRFAYPSRVAVHDGLVYIADSWNHRVVVWQPGATSMSWSFGTQGSGPTNLKHPRGLDFDAEGRLYVSDTANFRIQVFDLNQTTKSATLVRSFGKKYNATAASPPQDAVFRGDLRGMTIDPVGGILYQVDGEGNRIHRFTLDGTWLGSFGSKGNDLGQFVDGGREITIAGDGNLWIGDMPNFRVQVFSPTGTPLFSRPDPAQPPDPGGFNGPRGVALDAAGNIFVSDTYNQRVVKLANDGTPITQWGSRGRDDYAFNYMRMLATDPNDGSVVVADTDNHRIKKYDNDGLFLWELGKRGAGLGFFISPHGVDIAPDGKIYVADTNNARIVVVSPEGVALRAFGTEGSGFGQLRRPRSVVVDDVTGRVYAADSTRDKVIVWENDGTPVGEISAPGKLAHQLDNPFDVATDGQHVFIADSAANEIKVFTTSGTYVTKVGGTGTALGKFKVPQGLSLVGDRLYISERDNDRVTVVRVITDTATPGISIDPGAATLRPGVTAKFSGVAADESAVASVQVAVRNDAGQWLQANNTWGPTRATRAAKVTVPNATSTAWSWSWVVPTTGTFVVEATATDHAARVSPVAASTITSVDDSTAPETELGFAASHEFLGRPVTLTGTTIDAVATGTAQVGVKDRATGLWWNPTTGTWGAFAWFPATLATPGATSSDWSFLFDDSANPGSGDYFAQARSTDAAGNIDTSSATARFLVREAAADTAPPESVLTTPIAKQTYSAYPATFTGEAFDDQSVARVQLGVRDRVTGNWWNPATGTWGAFLWFDVPVASPGSPSTTWTYDFDDAPARGSGDYFVQVRAVDTAGSADPTPAGNRFLVAASA